MTEYMSECTVQGTPISNPRRDCRLPPPSSARRSSSAWSSLASSRAPPAPYKATKQQKESTAQKRKPKNPRAHRSLETGEGECVPVASEVSCKGTEASPKPKHSDLSLVGGREVPVLWAAGRGGEHLRLGAPEAGRELAGPFRPRSAERSEESPRACPSPESPLLGP